MHQFRLIVFTSWCDIRRTFLINCLISFLSLVKWNLYIVQPCATVLYLEKTIPSNLVQMIFLLVHTATRCEQCCACHRPLGSKMRKWNRQKRTSKVQRHGAWLCTVVSERSRYCRIMIFPLLISHWIWMGEVWFSDCMFSWPWWRTV